MKDKMIQILVTDPLSDAGISVLENAKIKVVVDSNANKQDLLKIVPEIDGWIIRSGTIIDKDLIHAAKKLQVIGRAGVGVDNIDLPAATQKGIIVMNTPDVNTVSAAEHTIGIMLSLARNISIASQRLNSGKWDRNNLVGTELRNKTIGIVGLGKIGREVMTRCLSFGMRVIGCDPYITDNIFSSDDVRLTDLDTLTKESDFISVHVPKLDSTNNLFDLERIKLMKSTSMIINVARGGIINEQDLAFAVKEGIIAGAAVDVFVNEPIEKDHPFINIDNILITPHLGASTKEAKEGVSVTICELVRDYLINNKLSSALNIPITDMNILKQIQPHLLLSERMGIIQGQLAQGAIQKVKVNVQGPFDDFKPFMLAFIKGLLNDRIPDRVNFINAELLAKERGIVIEYGANNEEGSYTNLISTSVIFDNKERLLDGSVFDGNQLRLVNILGYDMDINPTGHLLFVNNEDVPGVIGKVGTLLGQHKINIGAYILSDSEKMDEAFAVIRLDSEVPSSVIELLIQIPEILSVQQINC